jgi:hypothetical protein
MSISKIYSTFKFINTYKPYFNIYTYLHELWIFLFQ